MLAGFGGFSRLSDNKHFLSDVLFGAVLGTVVGRGVGLGRIKAAREYMRCFDDRVPEVY